MEMKPTAPLLVDTVSSLDKVCDLRQNPTEIKMEPSEISIKNKCLGLLCCTVSIISWIASAHVIKDATYNKPFFIMYIAGVCYIILLPIWYLMKTYSVKKEEKYLLMTSNDNDDINSKLISIDTIAKSKLSNSCWRMFGVLIYPSIILATLNLFVTFTWAKSLDETMVSINTAIFQSGVALIYIMSVVFLGMKISIQKIFGVIICIMGVLIISFYNEDENDDDVTTNSINGIIILIVSTSINSVMMIVLDYVSEKYFNKKSQDMIFLQSLMGFICLLLLWPLFWIFHAINVESFQLPSNKSEWLFVFGNGMINLAFFGGYFMSVVVTNAMFTSVTVLFVLPVGYFSDIIIYDYVPNKWIYVGTAGIIIGFLLIELPIFDYLNKKRLQTRTTVTKPSSGNVSPTM